MGGAIALSPYADVTRRTRCPEDHAVRLLTAAGDLPYLFGFIVFFTIPFAVHVLLVARGTIKLPPSRPTGAGHRLLGPLFVSYYYWLMGPVFRLAARSRLTPNHVTLLTLVVAVASAAAIGTGHFASASAFVILGEVSTSSTAIWRALRRWRRPVALFWIRRSTESATV